MSKGNIIISTSVAVGIIVAAIGGWFAQNRILSAATEIIATESRAVNAGQDKQIAAVVEAVQTLKTDNAEIKSDIKAILRAVK